MNRILCCIVLLLASGPLALASSIFSFDQPTYTVAPGGTVTIPVYLQLSGTDLANMIADDGMFSIGVRLTQDLASPPSQPASIAAAGDVAPNMTEFDPFPFVDYVSGANAGVTVFAPIAPSGPQSTSGQPSGRFLIANITFTAGAIANETTIFNAADIFPTAGIDDTLTFNGLYLLDPTTTTPVSITTLALGPAVVPSPTAALSGLALLGALAATRLLRARGSH